MIRTLTRKFSKLSNGKDMFFPKYGNSLYEYSEKEIKNTGKKLPETIKIEKIEKTEKKTPVIIKSE